MTQHDGKQETLDVFGAELRRRRLAAGLSLEQLAHRTHYSKGYLSKIETGTKTPARAVARHCDAALEAGGVLIGLVEKRSDRIADSQAAYLSKGVDRRDALTFTLASMLGVAPLAQQNSSVSQDEATIEGLSSLFDRIREIGQTTSPRAVLPSVISTSHALRTLAIGSKSALRDRTWLMAARYAEYAGWMSQEYGDDQLAGWWTDQAAEMATPIENHEFLANALVRHGLIALYQGDARRTVALSQAARSDRRASARVRGLAAQREAQGHALAGDERTCLASLEAASRLLAADRADNSGPVTLGTRSLLDPVPAITGWCLYDLGRPARSAQILANELSGIPKSAHRSRARFGARLALACAAAGDLDQACAVTVQTLDSAERVESATIRSDLRKLGRVLARWPRHKPARMLSARLAANLHVSHETG